MRIDYHDIDGAMRSRRVIETKSLWYIVLNAYGERERVDKRRVLRSFPEPQDIPSTRLNRRLRLNRRQKT